MNTSSNLTRTPKTKRRTLKLRVTIEQPAGWTIPMVQQLIKNGISGELRSGAESNPPLPDAIRIVEAVRITLLEATTVYAVGSSGDE